MSSKQKRRRLRARRGRDAARRADPPARQPAAVEGNAARTDRLTALVEQRRHTEQAIDREIKRLAASGVTWGEIGRALGISRQGARQRYGPRAAHG